MPWAKGQSGNPAGRKRDSHINAARVKLARHLSEVIDAVILAALNGGMSKAAVCRTFGVKRSTLMDTLARIGWSGPSSLGTEPHAG